MLTIFCCLTPAYGQGDPAMFISGNKAKKIHIYLFLFTQSQFFAIPFSSLAGESAGAPPPDDQTPRPIKG